MMTFEEAREFVEQAAGRGSILGLESIGRLLETLGNVQNTLPVIHIAGTNGKGSVGAYLASILMEAGLHVGRYTSPAVFDPLEVWQFDQQNISRREYARVMSQVKNACDILTSEQGIYPTVFEMETAAAFLYFAEKQPDYLLLETGMGGSTDATNIIVKPAASVITSISMDHMQFLGDTLEEIARTKAGIIKPGCPVFSAPQKAEAKKVLKARAKALGSPITFINPDLLQLEADKPGMLKFSYALLSDCLPDCYSDSDVFQNKMAFCQKLHLETSMAGHYQMKNAALAAETARAVLSGRFFNKPEHAATEQIFSCIQHGIKKARWQGRFEVIGKKPLFIIDGAHNEEAAQELSLTIQNCFTNTKITYIIGVLKDKEHEKMLKFLLPYAKRVYTVTPENPRALSGEILATEALKYHSDVTCCETMKEAVTQACKHPEPVLAFGSLSYLNNLKNIYNMWAIKNLTGG